MKTGCFSQVFRSRFYSVIRFPVVWISDSLISDLRCLFYFYEREFYMFSLRKLSLIYITMLKVLMCCDPTFLELP